MYRPPGQLSWDVLAAFKIHPNVWQYFENLHGDNEIPVTSTLIWDLLQIPEITADDLARMLFTASQYRQFYQELPNQRLSFADLEEIKQKKLHPIFEVGIYDDRTVREIMAQVVFHRLWKQWYG